jgi:glutamate-1-semialdehyde aminotransferase
MASTLSAPTNRQQRHLAELIQYYTQRTAASKQYAQTHRAIMADKSALGLGFSLPLKEMCYPIVVDHAAGAKLRDIDGNEYIDILMGLGINLCGHNPAFVQQAIASQLEKSCSLGFQSQLAGEVCQLIADLTGVERVTLSNTGTEAIMTAIRIARAAHDRPKIAVFTNSYHGHSDNTLMRAALSEYAKQKVGRVIRQKIDSGSVLSPLLKPLQSLLSASISSKAVPAALGIPTAIAQSVLVLDYGNPRSLDIIRAQRQQLAAVLVEPVQSRRPELQPREFLQQLRQVTQAADIALIFDEMVTGFRVAPGGAQAWFGVEADIVTYSKIIGGGLPLSAIAGKAKYLDRIDGGSWHYGDDSTPQVKTTFFAGTFCKHPLSLAAAQAMLQHLKTAGPSLQADLNQRTADLVAQLNSDFTALPLRFTHFGSFFAIDQSRSNLPQMATDLLSFELLRRGIHLRQGDRGGFLSTAHTPTDVQQIRQAFQSSIQALKENDFLAA